MRVLVLLAMTACGSAAPAHFLPPAPTHATAQSIESPVVGMQPEIDVNAEGHLVTTGLPAVSADGRTAVALYEIGDGMRGFPHVALQVFDGSKGGAARRTLPIIELSDTEDGPGDGTFLQKRVRARLDAVYTLLRNKSWVPLDASHPGLTVRYADQKLTVADTSRTLLTRKYDAIDSGGGGPDNVGCLFTPHDVKTYSDTKHRFMLVAVSYESGPDWCNMDDDVELVLLR